MSYGTDGLDWPFPGDDEPDDFMAECSACGATFIDKTGTQACSRCGWLEPPDSVSRD